MFALPRSPQTSVVSTVTTLGAIAALGTLLSGCGDGGDGAPTTVESSDAVTGSLPKFQDTAAIRDTLTGTDWECLRWSDIEEGLASCIVDNNAEDSTGGDGDTNASGAQDQQSIHGIYIKDQPGETAAVIFQSDPQTPAVVIGNNWLFDCGPGDSLSVDQCGEIAGILGGTIVLPEPM